MLRRVAAKRDALALVWVCRGLMRPLGRRESQRRGDVAQNVALGVSIGMDRRTKRKLKAGIDIPTPDEVKRLIDAAAGKWRALLITVVFTGLRASELRGLRWEDVDLKRGELHVRQRADRYNKIGAPKSHSGERTIPLGPMVVNTLREWRLACPKGNLDLVFPTATGHIDIFRLPVLVCQPNPDHDGR